MSRKLAREVAFKVVFSTNFQSEKDEIENLILSLLKESEEELTDEDKKYINDVAFGVVKNSEVLDKVITSHLKGWKMDRIGKTDLAILRVALYEIIYRKDIPYKVSINEAVELAKLFCDDSSPSFINGVLAGAFNEFNEEKNK